MDIKQELTNNKDLETSSDNEDLHCEVDFDLVLPDEDSEEANEDSDDIDTLNDLDYDMVHVDKDVDNDEPPLKVVSMDPGFRQKWIDQALQHPSPSKVHKVYFYR